MKPTVYYEGDPQFIRHVYGDITLTIAVLPYVVDHPQLGDCQNVRTSVVCSPMDDDGTFLTLNTRYTPHKDVYNERKTSN
jgi:hypothetical protein